MFSPTVEPSTHTAQTLTRLCQLLCLTVQPSAAATPYVCPPTVQSDTQTHTHTHTPQSLKVLAPACPKPHPPLCPLQPSDGRPCPPCPPAPACVPCFAGSTHSEPAGLGPSSQRTSLWSPSQRWSSPSCGKCTHRSGPLPRGLLLCEGLDGRKETRFFSQLHVCGKVEGGREESPEAKKGVSILASLCQPRALVGPLLVPLGMKALILGPDSPAQPQLAESPGASADVLALGECWSSEGGRGWGNLRVN